MEEHVTERFCGLLAEKGFLLTGRQRDQFDIYFKELVSWNEKINLTSITEREPVYFKHFYDSVSLSFFVKMNGVHSLADIGSGAGFPGLPLKILFPGLKVLIIDSLQKRVRFLHHLTERLGCRDVECVHARAEEAGRNPKYRDRFDLVTARAVAKLNVLCELCLPFVSDGGLFAAMKGSDPREEIDASLFSLHALRAKVDRVFHFELPLENAARHIILIRKEGLTPKKYPRKPGLPVKQPLQ